LATSVTVQSHANWPDYVFKKDYFLRPLSEVKSYIDENQHLPGVPTAQQIAANGLNLGEMNEVLVKKVEELTLYLIDKDKELKKEKQKNQEQDERIEKLEQEMQLLLSKSK
jgi:hypothetical protein